MMFAISPALILNGASAPVAHPLLIAGVCIIVVVILFSALISGDIEDEVKEAAILRKMQEGAEK
jgi:hypothetical protein